MASPLEDRKAIERAIRWRLSGDEVLKDAWRRYAAADMQATTQKRPTTALVAMVLVLATITVGAALVSGWLRTRMSLGSDIAKGVATASPLVAAGILALIDRRNRFGSWIDARAAAESSLQAIYLSRARALLPPSEDVAGTVSLGEKLAVIDSKSGGRSLLNFGDGQNETELWPPSSLSGRISNADSLVGPLDADAYDEARACDQLKHYERQSVTLAKEATRVAFALFAASGVSAFLLALSWRWPSLTFLAAGAAGVAASLVSWREYRQRDARVEVMHDTCVVLRSARGRWLALPAFERAQPEALNAFVEGFEQALAEEGRDWERGLNLSHNSISERYR